MDQQAFLRTILDLIRRHPATATPDGLKVAQVGTLLRQAHPDAHWSSYGYLSGLFHK